MHFHYNNFIIISRISQTLAMVIRQREEIASKIVSGENTEIITKCISHIYYLYNAFFPVTVHCWLRIDLVFSAMILLRSLQQRKATQSIVRSALLSIRNMRKNQFPFLSKIHRFDGSHLRFSRAGSGVPSLIVEPAFIIERWVAIFSAPHRTFVAGVWVFFRGDGVTVVGDNTLFASACSLRSSHLSTAPPWWPRSVVLSIIRRSRPSCRDYRVETRN